MLCQATSEVAAWVAASGIFLPPVAATVTAFLEALGVAALSDLAELDEEDHAALLAAVPRLKRKAFLERLACVPAIAAKVSSCAPPLPLPRAERDEPLVFPLFSLALCSQAAEVQAAAAEEQRKRAAAAQQESEACAAAGHPMGIWRCSTSANGEIAAGELGEVVGMSADGQLRVKFSKGTHLFLKEQLVTAEAFQLAEAVAAAVPT
jgi:hypothetical protein